ncbi:MAG: hypothetical protein E7A06_13140 [Clostridiales bacterium]|nr:hypothetical protein [Clostridiales bacterium]
MLEFEIDLNMYLNDIYKDMNLKDKVYNIELPLKYDFKNNKLGIYFTVNSTDDGEYKDVFSIDVNFYCLEKDKTETLKIIDSFDKKLNKKDIKNYWITHKSVYLIQLKEEELYHYVLSYNINKY